MTGMFSGKEISQATLAREAGGTPMTPVPAAEASAAMGWRARLTRFRAVRAAGRFAVGLLTIGRIRQVAYVTRDQVGPVLVQTQHHAAALDELARSVGDLRANLGASLDHLGEELRQTKLVLKAETENQAAARAVQGAQLEDQAQRLRDLMAETDHLKQQFARAVGDLKAVAGQQEWRAQSLLQGLHDAASQAESRSRALDARVTALAAALARAQAAPAAPAVASAAGSTTSAVLDAFYHAFEARFRGDRAEIKARQRVYLADLEAARARAGDGLIVDLGCGRGEWLELLREEGLQGVGVDTNDAQLEDARREGLAVHLGDGLAYLSAQPDASLLAVTAFHVIEHIPFDVLAIWLAEIVRVLKPGGVVILETPNPENLIVGATSFHMDPTHLKPVPRGLSTILAETTGFEPVETRLLHPHAKLGEALQQMSTELAYLLFGYQDYALIAQKPMR
jgi:O-antigen chain-terminating methyltransferase